MPAAWIPHLIGATNAVIVTLIVCAFVAIRRGERQLHGRLMKTAVGIGAFFLLLYGLQVALLGHKTFPGDDWVRTVFLVILTTHTALALVVLPLILRALQLALRGRFAEHRRIARYAFGAWLYVGITGVVVYVMNYHLRPEGWPLG